MIGREKEKKELEKLYSSNKAELVAIYGRRRVGRVGKPMDISNMILYLCSEKAGFITGENICIDGGMTKQMIYHEEYGWSLKKK